MWTRITSRPTCSDLCCRCWVIEILPNGQKGFFYPDNFTFGQTVYLSPVYAAARSVAGVISVTATQFQPQGVNSSQYLTSGQIPLGTLQVARLENDRVFPITVS